MDTFPIIAENEPSKLRRGKYSGEMICF